jgi:hypothetical protein
MLRSVLAVAAVLAACGVGVGQAIDPEREKQLAEAQKRWDKYLEKYPTEVPDVVAKLGAQVKLPKVEVGKDDRPVVKAAKRALVAEMEAMELIKLRIVAGQFQGGASYVQLTTAAAGLYGSAQVVWDDPEKVLPCAEVLLQAIAAAENFNFPRVEQGVEEPQLLPQLRAARCKAEVVVLQLREKAKK